MSLQKSTTSWPCAPSSPPSSPRATRGRPMVSWSRPLHRRDRTRIWAEDGRARGRAEHHRLHPLTANLHRRPLCLDSLARLLHLRRRFRAKIRHRHRQFRAKNHLHHHRSRAKNRLLPRPCPANLDRPRRRRRRLSQAKILRRLPLFRVRRPRRRPQCQARILPRRLPSLVRSPRRRLPFDPARETGASSALVARAGTDRVTTIMTMMSMITMVLGY